MGGIKKAGRWFDSEVLQSPWVNATPLAPMTLPYQFLSKKGLFAPPRMPGLPPMPVPPDFADQAAREVAEKMRSKSLMGSRKASFLTGPLGDQSDIPLIRKSILG